MEVRNMNEGDVDAFKKLVEERQKDNPNLLAKVFTQGRESQERREHKAQLDRLGKEVMALRDSMRVLHDKIKLVFGDHFLLNGQWTQVMGAQHDAEEIKVGDND